MWGLRHVIEEPEARKLTRAEVNASWKAHFKASGTATQFVIPNP